VRQGFAKEKADRHFKVMLPPQWPGLGEKKPGCAAGWQLQDQPGFVHQLSAIF